MSKEQFAVSVTTMKHKDRRNISETVFWGPFSSEKAANKFSDEITGKLVEVHKLNKPTAQ